MLGIIMHEAAQQFAVRLMQEGAEPQMVAEALVTAGAATYAVAGKNALALTLIEEIALAELEV